MDTSATDRPGLRERANDLYWDSDESVNQIADELELSKGTLYNLLDPRPSGLPCPRCSAEMDYPNRTARDRGYLACPECNLEEDEEEVRSEWLAAARDSETGTLVVKPGDGAAARRRAPADVITEDRVFFGAALLGAAAGLALLLWVKKR